MLGPPRNTSATSVGIVLFLFLSIGGCTSQSSISEILAELGDKKGAERYQVIKALSSEIPKSLSVDQLLAIIESSHYRINLIEMFKTSLPDVLSYEEFLSMVEPVKGGERFSTIKLLANRAPKSLTVDQLLAIIESSHYRVNLIEMLKTSLPDVLSYEEFVSMVEPVKGGERFNTIKLLANRAPKSLSVDQLLAIIESSHYRITLIEMLKTSLPDVLSYEEFVSMVEPVKGGERFSTIKLLANRAPEQMAPNQVDTIVVTSSYPDKARELLRH